MTTKFDALKVLDLIQFTHEMAKLTPAQVAALDAALLTPELMVVMSATAKDGATGVELGLMNPRRAILGAITFGYFLAENERALKEGRPPLLKDPRFVGSPGMPKEVM